MTRSGHIGLSKAMALAHTGFAKGMAERFWFSRFRRLLTDGAGRY
jgi:hypothetical protein